jgi:hypothetical protein
MVRRACLIENAVETHEITPVVAVTFNYIFSINRSSDDLSRALTFETVPEGYERFQRVTIQVDGLFTLLVHVDEQRSEEPHPHEAKE